MMRASVSRRWSQMAAWNPLKWGAAAYSAQTAASADSASSESGEQWVQWTDHTPSQHVAKLRAPQGVSSVVTNSKVLPVGAEVKQGQEVAVVEWVELYPFLPVQHRECVSSPCDGQVEYCSSNALMSYRNEPASKKYDAADDVDDFYVVVRSGTSRKDTQSDL